ncbi:hypothetical protein EDB85DRAFT_1900307 [Lactarius pseudohatsudake]|nr:hypothetical protein EDB85DRAFT_1900307 [Lactarius pseudohatsudake]
MTHYNGSPPPSPTASTASSAGSDGVLRVAKGWEDGGGYASARWAMRRRRGVETKRHEARGRAACLWGAGERVAKGLMSTAVHGGARQGRARAKETSGEREKETSREREKGRCRGKTI